MLFRMVADCRFNPVRTRLRKRTGLLALFMAAASVAALAQTGETGPAKPAEGRKGAEKMPGPPPEQGPIQRDERAERVLAAAIKAQGGTESIAGRQTIYLKYAIKNY